MSMHRVTRSKPCSICKKDSWCLIGRSVAICMRVSSGTPKDFKGGERGWVHPLDGSHVPDYKKPERQMPIINVRSIMERYITNTSSGDLLSLARKLGVSRESLADLEFCRSRWDDAWAVPMRDGIGNYIGIRIRHESGKKWAEPGSHSGIFIPKSRPRPLALIVEGPTDCAAALTLGYYSIGRPSCSGGVQHLVTAMGKLKTERAVIVADNDGPGIEGAKMLREFLPVPSCVIVLPVKDMRDFVKTGISRKIIDDMIASVTWSVPPIPSVPDSSSSR